VPTASEAVPTIVPATRKKARICRIKSFSIYGRIFADVDCAWNGDPGPRKRPGSDAAESCVMGSHN